MSKIVILLERKKKGRKGGRKESFRYSLVLDDLLLFCVVSLRFLI